MTWLGNPRTTTPHWRATRLAILDRDGWTCTMVVNGQRCGKPATEVDHIINWADGGTDDPTNLASLCPRCHGRKTSGEGHAARWRNSSRRKPETHPGLRKT